MAYIANKPVRFDRNYKVGEIIPDGVISPQMERRLVEMGRILCIDLPGAPPGTEPPQEGADDKGGVNAHPDTESAGEGDSDGAEGATGELTAADLINGAVGEFVCEVCGRKFQSQQGLVSHSRSHKE